MNHFFLPSPIQSITVENKHFYLKRDDLIHPDFSGNKARKFHYFLQNNLPHVQKAVSYGSSQSNAMYSLSVLAKMKGWEFEYFVDHIADYLKENPHGNYKAALNNGMQCRLMEDGGWKMEDEENTLFIAEGGRQKEAAFGIRLLAEEIIEWQKEQHIDELNVFLPSGTGTTALYLQKSLSIINHHEVSQERGQSLIQVFTCPCVGDSTYLKKQFSMLEEDEKYHPRILTLDKKHHFGKLYRENYEIWLKLQQQTGVEFDLLYDPLGWRTLLAHSEVYTTKPTLYIHQGGLLGNESMLPRYERKYRK
ncbi:1-aminocyclopropane-1-carboxylate deaminase [Sulfurovum lithotrophicum]|uniref:1-aminocyclopropane-1-carboxylate deaminase n=1 Tax=Sulfurovum lithotrophicum TaxID=206403 RepID=A0A7U4M0A0_9BACT|nr:1-aminocyclopropane-1-carboxylate deaminase/D-cysteine desulfhydrase [Sulfurovum lithotrophicum]AKF24481.1 1-aminocyclopropane-1-carboxylate deaminase [Sulfurovum lithotrophicum]